VEGRCEECRGGYLSVSFISFFFCLTYLEKGNTRNSRIIATVYYTQLYTTLTLRQDEESERSDFFFHFCFSLFLFSLRFIQISLVLPDSIYMSQYHEQYGDYDSPTSSRQPRPSLSIDENGFHQFPPQSSSSIYDDPEEMETMRELDGEAQDGRLMEVDNGAEGQSTRPLLFLSPYTG
jgi:hypothetical protein